MDRDPKLTPAYPATTLAVFSVATVIGLAIGASLLGPVPALALFLLVSVLVGARNVRRLLSPPQELEDLEEEQVQLESHEDEPAITGLLQSPDPIQNRRDAREWEQRLLERHPELKDQLRDATSSSKVKS